MGARGPAPKRSDQRRRRNKPETEITKAATDDGVKIPPASREWHPIARDWYRSLKQSGQSQFYTSSDWQTARYVAEMMSRSLHADKVNAQLFSGVMSAMTELLTTEGARRRAKLELERPSSENEEASDVSWIDDARARLRAAD